MQIRTKSIHLASGLPQILSPKYNSALEQTSTGLLL